MPAIERSTLIRIIDEATTGITASTRAKLLGVGHTADAVAVGWFHCDGVRCPASQANRRNQAFQEAFDQAVCAHLGIARNPEPEWPALPVTPFVLTITDT